MQHIRRQPDIAAQKYAELKRPADVVATAVQYAADHQLPVVFDAEIFWPSGSMPSPWWYCGTGIADDVKKAAARAKADAAIAEMQTYVLPALVAHPEVVVMAYLPNGHCWESDFKSVVIDEFVQPLSAHLDALMPDNYLHPNDTTAAAYAGRAQHVLEDYETVGKPLVPIVWVDQLLNTPLAEAAFFNAYWEMMRTRTTVKGLALWNDPGAPFTSAISASFDWLKDQEE